MKKFIFLLSSVLIFGMVSSFIFTYEVKEEVKASSGTDKKPVQVKELDVVGSFTEFKKMMKSIEDDRGHRMYMETTEELASADEGSAKGMDYSTTNVQVNGVDEADRIKTDGQFIYQIKQNKLVISDVHPAEEMEVVLETTYEDDFYPTELYVDEEQLVVIGSSPFHDLPKAKRAISYDSFYGHSSLKVLVYDLKERHNLELVREVEVEGHYISSRKIGNSLYLVSNKYIDLYRLFNEEETVEEETLMPAFRDSVLGEDTEHIDWNEIQYFPEIDEPNYLIIAGIDLGDLSKPASVSTYLGASQSIYASTDHLYVTKTGYDNDRGESEKIETPDFSTSIYKFKLENGSTTLLAEGEVEGQILNQFSMDEHDGHFRIATTTGQMWREDNVSKNHLFILDENLQKTGEIRDIAPNERIFSVRFMGDRGYMVTFKQVDPLFVFDLKDPSNPVILGKLKIPGYSDYLHPYDENHIIGFGKDAVGATKGDFAYYQGMKMALFDITDVNNPKEKFVEIIGDRGTDSEMLYNHKALLFSKEKDIISFPVNLFELPEGTENREGDAYGEFSFQGAYVYGLDLEEGFTLKKKITHITNEDKVKMGHYPDYEKAVQRIMYIGDTLYTLSNQKIEAHDINSFTKKGELVLP
ncbi:beta-propeller domain-containing protein [Bacillus carboniphilus]|uniref:Beta-propeller domain-containing protein n=3 Tax=Bacillati TaxID=1783272 RepID=A0ABP3GGR7_9BACI